MTWIDPERKAVLAGDRELRYDALVVALGAALAPETFPGYAEAAHDFFDLDGAAALAEALRTLDDGRVVVAIPGLPYKCPAAPYEAALLVDAVLRRRGLRERSEVAVFTPEPQPMPVAGPAMGMAVSGLVFADGARERFDLLAAVPPHRAPEAVRRSPLANEQGWITVDPTSLRTRYADTYAVGDVTQIVLANGKPLPKAGVFAHGEALPSHVRSRRRSTAGRRARSRQGVLLGRARRGSRRVRRG